MSVEIPVLYFSSLMPILIVILTAVVVMMIDLVVKDKTVLGLASIFGLIGAILPCVYLLGQPSTTTFQNLIIGDGYAAVLHLIFIFTAILSVLVALSYLENRGINQGEYYTLLLFSTSGMMLMAAATDLIIVFLGLEIMSIALYIMAAFNRRQLSSGEAGLKYFLLGAFASAFLLYGVALVYGATGSTNLEEIGQWFAQGGSSENDPLALVGLALLLVGFSFKISAVPFQWWTPDVYQGAPTSATAFMSVGAKAAGFAALVRVLVVAFGDVFTQDWQIAIAMLAIITMTVGNLAALVQRDIKRMLAYSSIAHAGYLLVGVAALGNTFPNPADRMDAVEAILFYLMAYTFMNIGAFTVVSILEQREKINTDFSDYTGLATRKPALAAVMLLFLLSLTGIPPFVGFWGKWYVFGAAVKAGLWWLAAIGVLNSVISAFYYLGVVIEMYMRPASEEDEARSISVGLPAGVSLAITSIVIIVLTLWPTPLVILTGMGMFG